MLTEEQLARIPEQHRPTGPVVRSFIDAVDIWLTKQPDPVATLFHGAAIVDAPSPPVPTGTLFRPGEKLTAMMETIEKNRREFGEDRMATRF